MPTTATTTPAQLAARRASIEAQRAGFAAAARQVKARKMADVLTLHHATADLAMGMSEKGRSITADLAGCHQPSPTTWALVCTMVAADARAMVA